MRKLHQIRKECRPADEAAGIGLGQRNVADAAVAAATICWAALLAQQLSESRIRRITRFGHFYNLPTL